MPWIREGKYSVLNGLHLTNPSFRIEKLLVTEDVAIISKYYRYMDKLVMIRRSTASTLTMNDEGETMSLRFAMPLHEVRIVELHWRDKEAAEAQWVHRAHARFAELRYSYWYDGLTSI